MSTDNTPTAPGVRTDFDFDVTGLDGECRDILNAIYQFGGEANTTQIKENAAVDRQEVNYRYDKLEDRGLIETFKDFPDGGGPETKFAKLTDAGRSAINGGLLEAITDTNTNLRQLRREVSELSENVTQKADSTYVSRQIDRIHGDVRDEFWPEINEAIDTAESAAESAEDAEAGVDRLADRIDELEQELRYAIRAADRARTRELLNLREYYGERLRSLEVAAARVDTMATKVDALTVGLGNASRRAERADERIEELRETVQDDAARLARLESQHQSLAADVDDRAAAERVAAIDDRLDSVESTTADRDALEELEESIGELEERLCEVADLHASLAEESAAKTRVEAIEQDLAEVREAELPPPPVRWWRWLKNRTGGSEQDEPQSERGELAELEEGARCLADPGAEENVDASTQESSTGNPGDHRPAHESAGEAEAEGEDADLPPLPIWKKAVYSVVMVLALVALLYGLNELVEILIANGVLNPPDPPA
jgi:DNA-binding MarR family transcriptional regulator